MTETQHAPPKEAKPNDPLRNTLNLPKTGFSMKANLVQSEPQMQKRWDAIDLYKQIATRKGKRGPFVFHDGPP